jgi:hypothetical protein
MSDQANTPPTPPPTRTRPVTAAESGVPTIGEEFDSAKRTLPPAKIVLIGVVAVTIVLGIVSLLQRPQSPGTGSIDDIAGVETADKSVLVAITFTMTNQQQKSMWIHTMGAKLKTDAGEFSDDAASPVDFARYFQAFPELKKHSLDPMTVETKIPPGQTARGTIIVSFPVNQAAFEQRKSLSVVIQPYDMPAPVVLTKP